MRDKIDAVGNSISERLDEAAASVNPFDEYLVEEYIERQSFENNMNIAVLTGDGRIIIPSEDRLTDSIREYWDGVDEAVRGRLDSAGGPYVIYETDNVYTYAPPQVSAQTPIRATTSWCAIRWTLPTTQ